jgi:hypothetical protein
LRWLLVKEKIQQDRSNGKHFAPFLGLQMMKFGGTKTQMGIFHPAKFILFLFIIFLLQSCLSTPTSGRRLEGSEFKKNLPGLWEGNWYLAGRSGKKRINIIKIDGNWRSPNLFGTSQLQKIQ